MIPDMELIIEGERVTVTGNTPEGDEFIDAWAGAILEVIDSGRIVIPREVVSEFTAAADGMQILKTTITT